MSKAIESSNAENQAVLMQIPVNLQIVIGSARLAFADIAELAPGSILSLDQKLGEPVSVEVNGVSIGRAELFVLDGEENRFAIRLIQLSANDEHTSS